MARKPVTEYAVKCLEMAITDLMNIKNDGLNDELTEERLECAFSDLETACEELGIPIPVELQRGSVTVDEDGEAL